MCRKMPASIGRERIFRIFWSGGHKSPGAVVGSTMSTLNAMGFVVCGFAMAMLPFVAPHYFPAGTMPGGTSTIWMEFMGWVNGLLGGAYLAVMRVGALLRRLAWNPPVDRVALDSKIARPALPTTLPLRPMMPSRVAA